MPDVKKYTRKQAIDFLQFLASGGWVQLDGAFALESKEELRLEVLLKMLVEQRYISILGLVGLDRAKILEKCNKSSPWQLMKSKVYGEMVALAVYDALQHGSFAAKLEASKVALMLQAGGVRKLLEKLESERKEREEKGIKSLKRRAYYMAKIKKLEKEIFHLKRKVERYEGRESSDRDRQ